MSKVFKNGFVGVLIGLLAVLMFTTYQQQQHIEKLTSNQTKMVDLLQTLTETDMRTIDVIEKIVGIDEDVVE